MPSFMHGQIEVIPMLDGPLYTTLEKIPDPAHRAEAEELVAKAGRHVLALPVYAFLLKWADKRVLIDTGSGKLGYDTLGRLPERLADAGVSSEDVTDILMTHLHRDHYGGLIRGDAPAFPNANLVIHKPEANFWLSSDLSALPERAQRMADEARRAVAAYGDRLRLVGTEDVFSGVRVRPAPGHTPGHCGWQVNSEGKMLLAWGDVIHVAAFHLAAPHIAMEYDLDPRTALESRLATLQWVAENNVIVAGAHLPEPGVWKVVKAGTGYELRSIE